MKHKKRIVALIIVIAGGLVVGAPRITAAPSTPGDEAIVAAMADPPAFLFYTACFEPT